MWNGLGQRVLVCVWGKQLQHTLIWQPPDTLHFLEFPTSAGKLGKTKTACRHTNVVWFYLQLTFNLAPSVLISHLLHYISVYRVRHLNRFGLKHTQLQSVSGAHRFQFSKNKNLQCFARKFHVQIYVHIIWKFLLLPYFLIVADLESFFFSFLLKCFARSVRKGNMKILPSGNRTFVNPFISKIKLCFL